MKIDKAIEVLSGYVYEDEAKPVQDFDDATKLGIEALKRCRKARWKGAIWDLRLLPGETEE